MAAAELGLRAGQSKPRSPLTAVSKLARVLRCEPHWFSGDVSGGQLWVQVLKAEVPYVGDKPLAPCKDALVLRFFLVVGHRSRREVYGKIVFQPLLLL